MEKKTLKQLRELQGMSTADVSRRAGKRTSWATAVERSKNPQLDTLALYLEAIGSTLELHITLKGETTVLETRVSSKTEQKQSVLQFPNK